MIFLTQGTTSFMDQSDGDESDESAITSEKETRKSEKKAGLRKNPKKKKMY